MICTACADAADCGAPATQHCGQQPGPGARCDCQHRPPRIPGADAHTDPTAQEPGR